MNIPAPIETFLIVSLGMEENAVGKGAISRAVASAMRHEGLDDIGAYERLFVSSPEAQQRLIDEIVVGETWFFRDREPFACLARQVRTLRQARPGETLKILSAPCSSGEEPYSIAIALFNAGLHPSAFAVDGVDISTRALDKARRACYGKGAFRAPLEADLAPFFGETPQGRQVKDRVARQVTFHLENLATADCLADYGPYTVVFCRNLLIYLTPEARRQLFRRRDALLLPGGLLFSGHTEAVFWQQQGYIPILWDRAFALTKPFPSGISTPPVLKRATTPEPTLPLETPCQAPQERAKAGLGAAANTSSSPGEPGEGIPPLKTTRATAGKPDEPPSAETGFAGPSMEKLLGEARRLADRGDMTGAVRLCREHEKAAGPAAEAYCLLGVIHTANNDIRRAEDCFLKALYLDPGHYEALVHASLLYRQKGDRRKADLYRERAERKALTEGKTMEQAH